MTCSWNTDFDTNNKNIHIDAWPCESNFQITEAIPPHGNFSRIIPVYFYPGQVKKGAIFKISMSLTIPHDKYLNFDLYPSQTNRYNLIWTNDIIVQ
jgi:hypothetical protein